MVGWWSRVKFMHLWVPHIGSNQRAAGRRVGLDPNSCSSQLRLLSLGEAPFRLLISPRPLQQMGE